MQAIRTFLQHAHTAAVGSLACGAPLMKPPLPLPDLLRVRAPAIPLCPLLSSCRPALLRIEAAARSRHRPPRAAAAAGGMHVLMP